MQGHNEIRLLVTLVIIGFCGNFVFGLIGSMQEDNTFSQLICYQLGDTFAIMAAVLAGRYVGIRGQHLAASAFILLGITHGISLAASGLQTLNVEKGIGVVMPMIPAFVVMFWLTLIPLWLRLVGFFAPTFFAINYVYVLEGNSYYSWPAYVGYLCWMITEVLWAYFLYEDYKREYKNSERP